MKGRAHWVQNIQHNPVVQITVGKKQFHGTGRILSREKDLDLMEKISKLMNEKYGWSEGTIVELLPI